MQLDAYNMNLTIILFINCIVFYLHFQKSTISQLLFSLDNLQTQI